MPSNYLLSLLVSVFASCATLSPRKVTLARMQEIRISEIRFREADITDVLSFLVQASREAETEGIGVGIVFMDPDPKASISATGPIPDPFGFGTPEESESEVNPPRITMSLRNVTLLEALEAVCDLADLQWQIHKNGSLLIERKL